MSDRLDQLDYYTLLGLEPAATTDAIREAFHTFARKYHPDRFSGAPEKKKARATQIYRRGAEAYRILMNARSRAAYNEALSKGSLRLHPEAARKNKNGAKKKMGSSARPFYANALQAEKRGDLKGALRNLKMALQRDKENAEIQKRLAKVEAALKEEG